MTLVFMGVSGCGKTTLGKLVAARLGGRFVEGDRFHPPANVEKMRGGIALDDDDRAAWLEALAAEIRRIHNDPARPRLCLSCSALKRRYRDVLRRGDPALALVFLEGSRRALESRVAARTHEYMPARLLDSQLEDLEPPQDDERHLAVSIELAPRQQAARVIEFAAPFA